MTVERGRLRSLKPCWTAADHDDVTCHSRRRDMTDTQVLLEADSRVDQARHRQSAMRATSAAHVARDAGPDLVQPPFPRFVRELGVSDERPDEADEVRGPVNEQLLCLLH